MLTLIHNVNDRPLVVKAIRGSVTLEHRHVVRKIMIISLVNPIIIRHVSSIVLSVL